MEQAKMKKGLILFNMSPRIDWEAGIVNRNYHIFNTLKNRKDFDCILSVDFLPFSHKKRLKTMLKGRPWAKNKMTVHSGFTIRVDQDIDDPRIYHMTATNLLQLRRVLQIIQFPESITLWSYNPFTAPIFEEFPDATIIFDAVDNWLEHPSYARYTEELEAYYKTIQKKADIIFTVSEGLIDFFGKKQHTFFIPNGVDIEHFQNGKCTVDKQKIPSPIIGYHGIIQSRVNVAVFEYLAKKHPNYQFMIIGPIWKEVRREFTALQKKYTNIHLLGAVPYDELPNDIHCFDVAIIPHQVDAFTQSMNPLKIYEYLAAGKPIVSSPVAGADQFQDLISLAVSPEDFSIQIELALAQDSDELRQRRKQMAYLHSWSNRVDLMLDIIKKHQPDVQTPKND